MSGASVLEVGLSCRLLTRADKAGFVECMASAFHDDPAPLFFLGSARTLADTRRFMAFMYDQAGLLADERWGLFAGSKLVAASLLEMPLRFRTSRLRLLLAAPALVLRVLSVLVVLPRGSLRRMNDYYRISRAAGPGAAWHYLSMIGVAAAAQGRGYGKRLLETLLAHCAADPESAGLALDTENLANVAWYARYGFVLAATLDLKGLPIYCMTRQKAETRAAVREGAV